MKILFNYASRSRPELFRRGVDSIINNMSTDNYEILAIVDSNDEKLKYYDFTGVAKVLNDVSKNKIDAINRGKDYILQSNCDIIVNMSDDMVFTKKGFDIEICNSFLTQFGFDFDQYIHFPDGNQNANLSTMHICGIDYYKRFNYIYNPEYKSLWCDVENDEVAKKLGKYRYIDSNIFVHLHPAWGKATFDNQYQHTESFFNEDKLTYLKRKEANYGL